MSRIRLLLLNCTKKSEPNEVEFLSQFIEMMRQRYHKSIEYEAVNVNTKREFKKQIQRTWPNIIHIAAHGDSKLYPSGNRGKETSIEIGNRSISSKEIAKLRENPVKLVFISACLNSYKDMADAFLDRGAEKFIAPKTDVEWVHAALFSATFYRRYVYDRTSFEASFSFAQEHTRLRKDFPEYWYNP